jgi:magnesium transporter
VTTSNGQAGTGASPPSPARPVDLVYYFLSELIGVPVRLEDDRRPFGRLVDIGVKTNVAYPVAGSLKIKGPRGREVTIPWSTVIEVTSRVIIVRDKAERMPEVDVWMRRDVLDDQVIDVSGAKLLRVNDVHMLYAEGHLIIGHVEVGLLSILRRLGYAHFINRLLDWLFGYTLKEQFVTWKQVQVISPTAAPGTLRVAAPLTRLADIHPAELADIIEQLGVAERQSLLSTLPVETAAEALEEVEPDVQRTIISQQEPGKAADLLEEMEANEAANVLRDLNVGDAQKIISRMEGEAAADVRTILAHEEESAGGVMTTSCIEATPSERVGDALQRLRASAEEIEILDAAFVLDEKRHLVGVLTLRELLLAAVDVPVESVMTRSVVTVTPETSVAEVAKIFVKYGFRALPVVDPCEVFLGAVPIVNILDTISEHFRE